MITNGETQRSIDQVRFENANNTCTITTAIGNSTQAIKDLINTNTMQDLRDRNSELANIVNNNQQTAYIVNALRPAPVPAYPAPLAIPFGEFGGCANHFGY